MDDPEHNVPCNGGRLPSGARAATLHERVAAVQRVLELGAGEAAAVAGAASPRLLEKYRAPLAEAMLALGETLAAFFEESTEPVDMPALRSGFLEPILAISRTLPIFSRALIWATDQQGAAELQELLFEGQPAGFDAQSLLLSDYYQHAEGAASSRSRVVGLMRVMQEELRARGAFEGRLVRVLVLGANGVAGLDAAMARRQIPDSARRASLSVFIVDPAAHALRHVRQTIDAAFNTHAEVLLCSPAALAQHASRPREPFDIVYALSQYDILPHDDALAFTASITPFVKPGGVLLTGCFLPFVSRASRALTLAFMGLEFELWDEVKWRQMLSALPYDLEASRFETHPPAALVVVARRKTKESR